MKNIYYGLIAFVCLAILIHLGCVAVGPRSGITGVSTFERDSSEGQGVDSDKNKARSSLESEYKGKKLTLAQCIVIALRKNPMTSRSWQTSQSADARIGMAKSSLLPSIDFTVGAARGNSVELDGQTDTGTVNAFSAGFGVRYLLFDGGARSAAVKSAEAVLLSADFQHNAVLQDVALAVEEAYYHFLAAGHLVHVTEKTVDQTKHHVDIAEARYINGIVAKSDVLKAKTRKAEADLTLVRARSLQLIARGRLANVMGLNAATELLVAELPEDSHDQEFADIKELMAQATLKRPELRSALAVIESKRTGIEGAKARYWPEIALDTSFGWRDRTFLPEQDEWSLGLGISVPLFDGFNRKHSIRHARSDYRAAIADYEKLLHKVELEVWITYARLTEARQAIKAAIALVASAKENALVAESEYKNGTGSIVEMIDAQTALAGANVQLVQARLDWYMAMARLEKSVGLTLVKGDRIDEGDIQE